MHQGLIRCVPAFPGCRCPPARLFLSFTGSGELEGGSEVFFDVGDAKRYPEVAVGPGLGRTLRP